MSPLVENLTINLAATLIVMVALWTIGWRKRDVSIVDIYWGLGFVVIAWISVTWNGPHARSLFVASLVTIWGGRLGVYLAWRKWGEDEDARYAAMRDRYGDRFVWVSLFTVFLLQGLLLSWIAFPLQVIAVDRGPAHFAWTDAAGLMLWIVGFFFEAVGDEQLARFKSQPHNKGRVMDQGLWRYTRHPNYFGEFLMWWGFYTISLAAGGWWTILSPAVMSFLLLRVSGVTLLESTITERRPDYKAYQLRTNAFFPGPRRAGS